MLYDGGIHPSTMVACAALDFRDPAILLSILDVPQRLYYRIGRFWYRGSGAVKSE
jgi:hypothetical protein